MRDLPCEKLHDDLQEHGHREHDCWRVVLHDERRGGLHVRGRRDVPHDDRHVRGRRDVLRVLLQHDERRGGGLQEHGRRERGRRVREHLDVLRVLLQHDESQGALWL